MNFYDKVYAVVCTIPKGFVMTYGQIAALCGNPRASRAVGYALHVNPRPGEIPCHRVVNREGALSRAFAFGGINRQRVLLEEEGVIVGASQCVDLETYRYMPLNQET